MRELYCSDVYDDPAPYSQGVLSGETIYLAGQVPDDETGRIVGDDIETQTRQAIANVEALLQAAGSSLADIVSVTAYLTDLDDLDGFNRVYAALFPDPKPARATVGVEELVVDARLELQVIGIKNGEPN